MKRLFTLYFAFISFFCSVSAENQFIYTQISQEEGLTSTVNCIHKEKDGDVWLGTPNGLYRFNGYDLIHYEDPVFKGRKVLHISEDKEKSLWILTDTKIIRRRYGEDTFCQIHAENHEEVMPYHSMCLDDEGIWFGSVGCLFRYTYADEKLYRFTYLEDRPTFICRHMSLMNGKSLLCCSHNGMILVDKETGAVSATHDSSHKEISAALVDCQGRLWIAFYNNGIAVYDREGKLIKRYTTSDSNLSNNVILCFTERESKIWAGTDGGGINIIDPETDGINVISHIAGDQSSFPAHSIKSIYTDHYGNIWAGSIRDGLIRISRSGIKTYSDSHIGLSAGLSNPTVLCLYQDKDTEDIWIGTDGEGLNRFDPETNRFTHYSNTLKSKIVSIARYSDSELALSSYADRVWLFNKHTGKTRPLEINDTHINYLLRYAGRSLNLAESSDGELLMISNTVSRFDKTSGKCIPIPTEDGAKAEGHFLTIGTSDRALWLHDFKNIYTLPDGGSRLEKKGRIENTTIRCGHIGQNGEIWLATDKGLCRYDINGNRFDFIETGLFNEVSSVVYDNDKRIWLGTDKGLFAYITDIESFAMFGKSDGVRPNEFLSKPRLLSHNGDIYMGGVQGLLVIDKDYVIDASKEPYIRLHELSADNIKITADNKGVYKIPRDCKSISISVSTQEKDIFRNKVFRFSFSGKGSTYEIVSPTLTLQDFPKRGKYDVMVSCTKRNGDWSKAVRIMTLKIPQPWYLTWWFIGSMILLLLLTIGSYMSFRLHKKESMHQLELKEKEQQIYEEKVSLLINMSHELRTPLTLIMAPLKRLLNGMDSNDANFATLGRIYRQSRRMGDLVNMILDLRKMEVSKTNLKIENCDFNKWLAESTEDIVNEEHAEGIDISYEFDPAIGNVDFDRGKCDTVMTNILINAIKHSRKGDRIIISTRLTEDGKVRTSISDQGPGLGDIDKSRLFTRFYQSKNEQYGSGIGLSYSKILVELHGGSIGAVDNEDKGATFWWEIPANAIVSQTTPKAYINELIGHEAVDGIQAPAKESFSTAGMRLMLVDDSQDLLDFLCEALNDEFAEIITAQSGNKALAALSSGRLPDIIVSDVNMPDGDGYSLCNEIKQSGKYSHIPVVLLTARGEQQSQSDSYRIGAEAFMSKPFEAETLLELLRSILRRKEEIRRKYLDSEEKSSGSYGSNEESFIIHLNRIISEHISDPELDQQLLCRELGVSRASLYNKMKAITGSGAKEYITRIRLEKAKSLIENTEMTIAEISDMTGFSSQGYFSTAFKNYTGQTPSQYKKNQK